MVLKWFFLLLLGISLIGNGNASFTFALGIASNIAASVLSYAIVKRMRKRDEKFERERVKKKEAGYRSARSVRTPPTAATKPSWDWVLNSTAINDCFNIIDAKPKLASHLANCVGVRCEDPVVCVKTFPELTDCFNRTVQELVTRIGPSVDVANFIQDFSGFTNCTTTLKPRV